MVDLLCPSFHALKRWMFTHQVEFRRAETDSNCPEPPAGSDISVRISDGNVSGQMQRRALALVLEWCIFIARNFSRTGTSRKLAHP
jgi:hypothetical protein